MEEELISINIWLAGRSYRLRVKPEEESAVRKAVKLADDKISEMKTQYAGKDEQDFMAMCLLSYAADTAIDLFNNPLLNQELENMTKKIDKALQD
jgi:cell division protein ZapA